MKPDRNDLLHAETCALITVVLLAFLPWWAACPLTLAIGIGKETWDKGHGGVAKWSDLAWDAVGAIIGTVLTII